MIEYRISPQGVLAKRTAVRRPGWMVPHYVVVDVPPGDHRHYISQELNDAEVESWAVLVPHWEPEKPLARNDSTARPVQKIGFDLGQ